jgi:hypothetical protein
MPTSTDSSQTFVYERRRFPSARRGDAKMTEEGAGDHGRQRVTTDGRGDWQGSLRLRQSWSADFMASEAKQSTWGLRLRLRLDRVAVARNDRQIRVNLMTIRSRTG